MSYKVESNHKQVLDDLRKKLQSLDDNEPILRTAALSAIAVVLKRNQQGGKNSDGSTRKSKSKKTSGSYSAGYAKKRRRKGRQTNIVDLTMEGDLMRSFDILSSDKNSVDVGFTSERETQKAEYLEAYYGEMFSLSEAEEKLVMDGAVQQILKKLQ